MGLLGDDAGAKDLGAALVAASVAGGGPAGHEDEEGGQVGGRLVVVELVLEPREVGGHVEPPRQGPRDRGGLEGPVDVAVNLGRVAEGVDDPRGHVGDALEVLDGGAGAVVPTAAVTGGGLDLGRHLERSVRAGGVGILRKPLRSRRAAEKWDKGAWEKKVVWEFRKREEVTFNMMGDEWTR